VLEKIVDCLKNGQNGYVIIIRTTAADIAGEKQSGGDFLSLFAVFPRSLSQYISKTTLKKNYLSI